MGSTDKNGRIALWAAIFGALVGGTLSFLGSYLTTQTQGEMQQQETKRASYVKLVTEAEEYRLSLIEMLDAAREQDEERYEKAWAEDWKNAAALHAASAELRMLASKEEQAAVEAVTREFFGINHQQDYQNVDFASLEQGINDGAAAVENLIEKGKTQFGE